MPGWVTVIILIIFSGIVVRFGMGVHSTMANLDILSQEKIMNFEQQVDQQAEKNRMRGGDDTSSLSSKEDGDIEPNSEDFSEIKENALDSEEFSDAQLSF